MEQAIPRPHARKSNVQAKAAAKKPAAPMKMGSHTSMTSYYSPMLGLSDAVEQVRRPAPVANMIAQPPIVENQAPIKSSLPAASLQATAELALDPALFDNSLSNLLCDDPMTEPVVHQQPPAREGELITNVVTELPKIAEKAWQMDTSHAATDDKAKTVSFEPKESFDQPASSLVSPPASSHEDAGHSPTGANGTWSPSASSSRQSSSQPKQIHHQQRYTPESGPMRRASSSSYGDNNIHNAAEKASSPTAIEPLRSDRKPIHKRLSSESMADEESLRLIKELQAQEYGLRRRGNGVM